jgi:hypothetical protein
MTGIGGSWYNYYCDALLQFICEAAPITPSPTQQPVYAPTFRPSSAPTLRPTTFPTPTFAPTLASGKHHQDKKTHSPTITSTTYGCPSGYTPIHSTCYAFVSSPASFALANETCVAKKGWLVTIETEVEDEALLLWLQSISDLTRDTQATSGPFIGLYRDQSAVDHTGESFHWLRHATQPSHSRISSSSSSSSYTQWALNYPLFDSSSSSDPNCVVISMESGWMNVDCSASHQYVCETMRVFTHTASDGAEDGASSNEQETMLWSLLAPITLLAGGFLFFVCSRWKSAHRGPDHQYLPDEESEQVASTHSLVHDDRSSGSSRLSHTQQGSPDNNGKYLSKYNYADQSSPEETMEIQLQMRSYAPLTQNSV